MTIRNIAHVTAKVRKARLATCLGFIMIGGMMYIWSTGVSAFRHALGLQGSSGDTHFGMIAFGIGAGAAVGALLTGKLLDKYGARVVVRAAVVLYPCCIIPLGFVSDLWFALAFGVLLGLFRGATETALNAHGVQVERFYGRPIMSGFHACFSLGGFALGMVGSYFASLDPQSAAVPFLSAGVALTALSLYLSRFLLESYEVAPCKPTASLSFSTLAPAKHGHALLLMWGFGLLLLGVMIGEGAIGDWGQEYLHREMNASTSLAGLGITFFTGAQFIGRLLGDRATEYFGAARVVFISGLLSLMGLLLAVIGHNTTAAMAGFALFGLGMSCLAPLLLSSAGRKDPANAGKNIGIVNCIGFSGMLIGPAGISLIVSMYGIGVLLFFPILIMCLLTLFGPRLVVSAPGLNHQLTAQHREYSVDIKHG